MHSIDEIPLIYARIKYLTDAVQCIFCNFRINSGDKVMSKINSHPFGAVTLGELRSIRGLKQEVLAATIGVGQTSISRAEGSVDPKLSTLQTHIRALGGELALIAAFPLPDGSIEKFILRTPGEDPGQIDPLAPRWRNPLTRRPSAEARRSRIKGGR